MSNRAREIMGQVLDEKFRHTWTTLDYGDLVVFSEKFTELVVKECVIEFVRKLPVSVNVSNRARHVVEHFGVEL